MGEVASETPTGRWVRRCGLSGIDEVEQLLDEDLVVEG
jgi:hypothetical protein